MLRKGGVDVINIADGPRATVRMSNSALAEAIQREVTTRHRVAAEAIQREVTASPGH